MQDETASNTSSRGMTRRSLLAAAGVSAIAGCSSIDSPTSGNDPTIRTVELPDVDAGSVPEPVVAPSVPVDVDPAYFVGRRDRINELLASLPIPLGPDDVPNGHVRDHLSDAADTATNGLDEARTARTDLVALQSLRDARGHARYAAAGWAVAERRLSVGPLRRAHRSVVADAQSFREDHEYVGRDPIKAALVHARIEEWLDRVTDADRPRIHDERELLTVAEWGETVESAQAYLDDAAHLDERFRESLSDDTETVADDLARAAEVLSADTRSRRSDLPPEPTAEKWGLTEEVVHELRRGLDRGPYSVADAHGPASAVVDLTDRLTRFRALERVQERIEAGEITSAENAGVVRDARTAAYDALDAALADSPNADLARTVLSDVSWRVSNADQELDRYRRRAEVSATNLDDIMEEYIITAAIARATPDACQQTANAFDAV
ncbi:hypothetical protein [Haloplanus pelagicus]|uniref:hypothetical protein n=1 Tax=Haloplanus pelagicus TaxID=2949995 RepID=UPI0020421FBE|nr:hypothetical protein [Haloplanus sp. HW8-1]